MIRLLCLFALLFWSTAALAERMRLAVTTSFQNSGLSDVLLPAILDQTGVQVDLLVVGTGQALRLGRAGDVDAVLVHARPAEEAFVADGSGTERVEIMFNDFVLVGPAQDPAAIAGAGTVTRALQQIAQARHPFVSRGDDSGTHQRERALWTAAALSPEGAWYREVGAGMGHALNTASGLGAYILTDRATWLNFGNPGDLALLFAGDPMLYNQYAYLPVNPARHPHVNAAAAGVLRQWLTSDRAAELINGYQVQGQQLFTHNARP